MAKLINAYAGYDSFGTPVNYAETENGAFVRFYKFNGFAKAWSKWEEHRILDRVTEVENAYTGEIEKVLNPENQVHFGFSRLTRVEGARWRLPRA